MLEAVDAGAVRSWCRAALDRVGRHREEIDALNVFPVPDGDTGTNLFLTLEAALDGVEDDSGAPRQGDDLVATLRGLAHGALLGARGNSGVILSQLLRGVADTAAGLPTSRATGFVVDATALTIGLRRAADGAYAAVAEPVEGTMLTVARAAADGARDALGDGGDLVAVVRAARLAALEALGRTPEQLPALAAAGVVDAGGRGYVELLDAMLAVVTGEPVPEPAAGRVRVSTARLDLAVERGGPAYEVMYLLEAEDDQVPALRAALAPLGDSLVVVGGDGLWNVHVHVDEVGPAVEAGIRAGRPYRIVVTHFADQATRASHAVLPRQGRRVVAVAAGPGLAALLESVAAAPVLGGPGRRPSTAMLLDAVHATGADEVVLLPGDKDTLPVAEAAAERAREEGVRVAVIPSRAAVQSLAALAVHEPGRRFDDDVVAMTSAAGATRFGSVTLAVREAMTSAGICQAGDVLGMVDDDVAVIGDDVVATACEVVDRMLSPGNELVTLVVGEGAPAWTADQVVAHLHRARPDVEVVVYDGGQPHYPLLVGVE